MTEQKCWTVRTAKGVFTVYAETSSRASQKAPGKTIEVKAREYVPPRNPKRSVELVEVEEGNGDSMTEIPADICPPGCTVDHDAKWRTELATETQASQGGTKSALVGYLEERPTAKQLILHARRYGPEGVQEIADAYGIELGTDLSEFADPHQQKLQRRARPVPKKQQAQVLLDLGNPWSAIEDTLDLSRSDSARLKEELGG